VLWEDVLKDIGFFKDLSPNNQGVVVKIIGFVYGLLTVGMAFIAGSFSGILAAALVVFGAASGPILGVFVLGIFMPFVNKYVILIKELLAFFVSINAEAISHVYHIVY
jgi:sodium-coupled monocarboxylate transporter 8/12